MIAKRGTSALLPTLQFACRSHSYRRSPRHSRAQRHDFALAPARPVAALEALRCDFRKFRPAKSSRRRTNALLTRKGRGRRLLAIGVPLSHMTRLSRLFGSGRVLMTTGADMLLHLRRRTSPCSLAMTYGRRRPLVKPSRQTFFPCACGAFLADAALQKSPPLRSFAALRPLHFIPGFTGPSAPMNGPPSQGMVPATD